MVNEQLAEQTQVLYIELGCVTVDLPNDVRASLVDGAPRRVFCATGAAMYAQARCRLRIFKASRAHIQSLNRARQWVWTMIPCADHVVVKENAASAAQCRHAPVNVASRSKRRRVPRCCCFVCSDSWKLFRLFCAGGMAPRAPRRCTAHAPDGRRLGHPRWRFLLFLARHGR